MSKKEDRPDGTTMEGMIWNANHVLEKALSPNVNGMPKKLFEEAVAVIMVNAVQLGCIFSGCVGTGIILKKTPGAGKGWSPPSAVGLSGIGFGILIGASAQDLMIFVFDDVSVESLTTNHGMKLGAQLDVTVGPFGRAVKDNINFSKKGVGATLCMAYTKGAFAGLSIDGACLGTRDFVNNKFYSAITNAKDILCTPGSVVVPEHKATLLNEVYDKLNMLAAGATGEPSAEDEAKKNAAKEVADKEAEAVKDSPDVVKVDAAAEAAKEASS